MADYVLTVGDTPESETGNKETLPTELTGTNTETHETRTDGSYCGCGVSCTGGCGANCTGTSSNNSVSGYISKVTLPVITRERFSGLKIK